MGDQQEATLLADTAATSYRTTEQSYRRTTLSTYGSIQTVQSAAKALLSTGQR